jgi:hypothetical protein
MLRVILINYNNDIIEFKVTQLYNYAFNKSFYMYTYKVKVIIASRYTNDSKYNNLRDIYSYTDEAIVIFVFILS